MPILLLYSLHRKEYDQRWEEFTSGYAAKGVAAPNPPIPKPAKRHGHVAVPYSESGKCGKSRDNGQECAMYVFGGSGCSSGNLNDMWKYSPGESSQMFCVFFIFADKSFL